MRYLSDAASEEVVYILRRTLIRYITVRVILIASLCVKNLSYDMFHYYASATSDVDQLIYLRLCYASTGRPWLYLHTHVKSLNIRAIRSFWGILIRFDRTLKTYYVYISRKSVQPNYIIWCNVRNVIKAKRYHSL